MKKEKPPVTYDTRYRYKPDMLEPGTIMLKWVGIFLLIGLALELLRWKLAAAIAFGFSGALFLLLLILLAIEAHQDRVLNEIAAQEHRDTDCDLPRIFSGKTEQKGLDKRFFHRHNLNRSLQNERFKTDIFVSGGSLCRRNRNSPGTRSCRPR